MSGPYVPPLPAIRRALSQTFAKGDLSAYPGFEHARVDEIMEIVGEFGSFCAEVLAPLNQQGDEIGARHDPATGEVTMPPGWKEAYAKYIEAGWGTVSFGAEEGGGNFPWVVTVAMQEILNSANMSFSLCPLLTQGAVDAISTHGSEEQKATYLPNLVTGQWSGTMNLTEPQAGSDVGALTSRAVPADDGTWRITGQKIFITYGEHDMSENIIHLVLARTPGAAAGTRGISLFIVPKFLVGPDGKLGDRNSVRCTGIEKKMGIHASPTCSLAFEDATGFLLGAEGAGMRAMFTMMNNARLSVGVQGLGIAERAYQAAAYHARERVQGRTGVSPAGPDQPIIEHPDIRAALLTIRSQVEAMRGLTYLNGWAIDTARAATTPEERQHGRELADLLTPLSKAWSTDLGSELSRIATQIHGGMGFIRETGVEQYERDVRITSIYEGTNGIQAIDLVTRKVPIRDGAVVFELIESMVKLAGDLSGRLDDFRAQFEDALDALRDGTEWLLAHRDDQLTVLAAATPYLRLMSTVVGGYLLAEQARVAEPVSVPFVDAQFYGTHVLPQARALLTAVKASPAPLFALEASTF